MRSNSINPIIKWWLTPKFPDRQIENFLKYNPPGLKKKIRNYYRTWLFHPIRRRIAKSYLGILRKFFGLKVIGITGSAGKTTTKEFLASILGQNAQTVYSVANIDPVYNIPTTILKCRPNTKYLILEMGVEYPNEMGFYLWLAKPDVGIITNIFPTHTEFFIDRSGVFEEKSKLVEALSKDDTAVLNYTDDLLRNLDTKLGAKIEWFGEGTNVSSSHEVLTKDFKTKFLLSFNKSAKVQSQINLSVLGYQYVANALAASACAKALGFKLKAIKKGLEIFDPPPHRMNVIKHESGAIIIDDSYNNNPEAAKASLRVFSAAAGRRDKIVVFGDMKELGILEFEHHRQIGDFIAKNLKPKLVICVGQASKLTCDVIKKRLGEDRALFVDTPVEALEPLKQILDKNSAVLIKGSRSIGLEALALSL